MTSPPDMDRPPFAVRWKLARQRLYAALRVNGDRPVALDGAGRRWIVRVDGMTIAVPSPLRWKLYRKGWDARLDRLEREYGVGRRIALGPQSVVIDVGANAGEFAHVAARYGARVFCLEPDPIVRACLEENVAALPRASVHNVAAWRETGALDFGLAPDRADSSAFVDGEERISAPAATLDEFCTDENIDQIDLIKCDAEGAEPEVLMGLNAMAPKTRAIALDTGAERRGARTHAACADLLSARGFEVIEEKVGTRWMTYGVRQSLA